MRLRESDDIETYLATIEWTMHAHKVPVEPWVYQLAPQLAEMPAVLSCGDKQLQEAILRC